MGSSIDLKEHHFNQHIDQQHMQQTASHLKHHQIMSNIFKRNMHNNRSNNYGRTLDFNNYNQHKEADVKPYNHYMHHHSSEMDSHHDDIDHNDSSANEDNDNAYNNDIHMLPNTRHDAMGENLSMSAKKLNDAHAQQHYCHVPQQSQETL